MILSTPRIGLGDLHFAIIYIRVFLIHLCLHLFLLGLVLIFLLFTLEEGAGLLPVGLLDGGGDFALNVLKERFRVI